MDKTSECDADITRGTGAWLVGENASLDLLHGHERDVDDTH